MNRCTQPHCRGGITSEGDREVCLLCGRVYRDDAKVTDATFHALSGLSGFRSGGGIYTNSSRRYTSEALTDGLAATKGHHDV